MRILIVKTTSLGDIVQSFPAIALLREHFPYAEISWVVESPFQELLKAHPQVDCVIPIAVRKWRKNLVKYRSEIKAAIRSLREKKYDLLIDLQGNIKSGLITKCVRAAEKVGTTFASAPEWPSSLFLTHRYPRKNTDPITLQYLSILQQHLSLKFLPAQMPLALRITPAEKKWIDERLVRGKRSMICPGSRWENKKLSSKQWIALLERVNSKESSHMYFVWGSEKEKEEAKALHAHFSQKSTFLPKMTLPVWQRLMSQMDCIYAVDSSALHLAGTTAVPTWSFFGPSSSAIYKPVGEQHRSFQARCPYGKTFTKRCPLLRTCSTGACLKNLELAQQVDFP